MRPRSYEKRKRIIRALTNKSLTWNELIQETKLPKATLHRHLKRLISDNIVHKIPTVYSLSSRIEVIRPQEAMIVKTIKRVKSGKTKLIPLVAIEKGKNIQ